MKLRLLIYFFLLAFVQACMVGPKYTRPSVNAPGNWQEVNRFVNTADSISNLKWFQVFNDDVLDSLIAQSLKHNYSLANAALSIEQARAVYGITKADLLPNFGYTGKASVNNIAGNNEFSALGTSSWELDFWGKIRHNRNAAYSQMLASEEGRKVIITTLVSDVASLYFLMRDYDNRLLVCERMVESRTKYYDLINARFKGGDVSELDVLQADQQLSFAKATVQSIKRQLNFIERSLNILLGQMPQNIPRGLNNVDQANVPLIPAGLPSTLLNNRPDVKQAEYQLVAETEKIGITIANRLPAFSLTGFLGVVSPDITSVVSSTSYVANATARILGPLFNWEQNKRRVIIQRKEAEIATNRYLNTYISALGEVENALVSVQTYSEEYEARYHQAEVAGKSLNLSKERYNNGYTAYLEVLVAENVSLDSELQASATKGQQLAAYIRLYRALGGGW